jgi:transmembrane sensor
MNPREGGLAGGGDEGLPRVTRDIAAEAAVWIARLHGPDRSPQMERECREWQARSAAHRLAFERCTDTWEDVAGLTLGDAYAATGAQRKQREQREQREEDRAQRRLPRWVLPLGLATCVSLGAVAFVLWPGLGVYTTGVGEQRVMVLDDGSRLSLNTHSRVRVDMDSRRRTVDVDEGEALFEVAKDPLRPFVVRAAGSEVVAHGTVFSVRLMADRAQTGRALDVTLIEGRVTVQAESGKAGGLAPAAPVEMRPGDRVRLAPGPDAHAMQRVDRPRLEGVTAWKRNEAVFDDVVLGDAVAEMNRYDRRPIVLVGAPSLALLRVSGTFRIGDTASFARSVADLHGLVVRERAGRLELANPP